jgi:hypothetical protein
VPACGRIEQPFRYLHLRFPAGWDDTTGELCPATGVHRVRVSARRPVRAGAGLPFTGWWCSVCRFVVADRDTPSRGAHVAVDEDAQSGCPPSGSMVINLR